MRLRITFSKTGALRYIGHLDLQTTWERTIRRAGLPLAYTQGFHPGPRIQIASALPLGFIGHAEIVDVWLTENVGSDPRIGPGMATQATPYQDILQAAAPPGLTVAFVEQVDALGLALQTQVTSAEYEVTLLDPVDEVELAKHLAAVLMAESLPRERRGKTYNLRPLIEGLSILPATLQSPLSSKRQSLGAFSRVPGEDQGMRVFMRLAARQGATGRPEEVLDVLGIPFESTRIERTRLILKSGIE